MPDAVKMKTLSLSTGVSKEGKPFVHMFVDGERVAQVSPAEAREHALHLIEAAEAAEQDAFMLDYARRRIGADDNAAAGLLVDFRNWRESRKEVDGQNRRSEN